MNNTKHLNSKGEEVEVSESIRNGYIFGAVEKASVDIPHFLGGISLKDTNLIFREENGNFTLIRQDKKDNILSTEELTREQAINLALWILSSMLK